MGGLWSSPPAPPPPPPATSSLLSYLGLVAAAVFAIVYLVRTQREAMQRRQWLRKLEQRRRRLEAAQQALAARRPPEYTLEDLRKWNGTSDDGDDEEAPVLLAFGGDGVCAHDTPPEALGLRRPALRCPITPAATPTGRSPSRITLPTPFAVYDVTDGREFYGRRGVYHALTGRDASRLLAKGLLDEESAEEAGRPLTSGELAELRSWQDHFGWKYARIGALVEGGAAADRADDRGNGDGSRVGGREAEVVARGGEAAWRDVG